MDAHDVIWLCASLAWLEDMVGGKTEAEFRLDDGPAEEAVIFGNSITERFTAA